MTGFDDHRKPPGKTHDAGPIQDLLAEAGIKYAGSVQYIWNNDDLRKVAVANLGPMNEGTFESYMDRARVEAPKHGIENPKLIIDIELKPEHGGTSQPYPISRDEWTIFVSDARTMAKSMPQVYLVDGNKYTAPI